MWGYGAPHLTLDGWKAHLDQLLAIGTGKVHGGRGDSLPVAEAAQQIAMSTSRRDRHRLINHGVNDGPGIWWAFLLGQVLNVGRSYVRDQSAAARRP
ncbi:hypothetical protein X769_23840 [Mesorhizobium sp. LSJC268A00]|uniref:hypothetical protein n=1 Tax=unclassified Mesorhizobium TaxID=325217 RepID=UPI0003CF3BAE|nr:MULTISPECIES: hypothetical protein [unclassified Mesorhizobium]ESW63257.1 hypothetical protein X771_30635 [Mesorhizobium sp. LSJC277A00]ESW80020.1 hypothetical protein X773_16735 [Mesorhizobium sp. LSJC285A00]ESW99278.1 hypothetical protein X769_23840 [Mesorhizobium sp. LSJC268A00]ESX09613.1 hypothetical protein X766_33335 [Mesorhizobium sp. LSJC255A00]ESZ35750.1 hypothetical protein X731_30455 [Mesorhizobium sp. L2C054A000]